MRPPWVFQVSFSWRKNLKNFNFAENEWNRAITVKGISFHRIWWTCRKERENENVRGFSKVIVKTHRTAGRAPRCPPAGRVRARRSVKNGPDRTAERFSQVRLKQLLGPTRKPIRKMSQQVGIVRNRVRCKKEENSNDLIFSWTDELICCFEIDFCNFAGGTSSH